MSNNQTRMHIIKQDQQATINADLYKIFESLLHAAARLGTGNTVGAFEKFASIAATGFSTKSTQHALSYELTYIALKDATLQLAVEYQNHYKLQLFEIEELTDELDYPNLLNRYRPQHHAFFEGIKQIVQDNIPEPNPDYIWHPHTNPLLIAFKEYLHQWFSIFLDTQTKTKTNYWTAKDIEIIVERLPTYFIYALHKEWQGNYTKYLPLQEEMELPTQQAKQRERQWEAYNAHLQAETERPIFGDSFGLNKIFVPLRAYYQPSKTNRSSHLSRGETPQVERKNKVVKLKKYLNEWLTAPDQDNKENIIILSGNPGSGKSSFAKMWAAEVAKEAAWRVLFIPLHRFNIEGNLSTSLNEYINQSDDMPFDYNPLETLKKERKLLLIFDGLDELSKQGEHSNNKTIHFINDLKGRCQNSTRIKILISGRPISIQNAKATLLGKAEQTLHLLPYFVGNEAKKQYEDIDNLLATDYRQEWWNKYIVIKNIEGRNMPKVLQNANLDKLTPEPLLNYLIAISWRGKPHKFTKDTNINEVYYKLIEGVYQRDYENQRKHTTTASLDFPQFLQILEEIALCAWHGGEVRITTVAKIEAHLQNSGNLDLLEQYKQSVKGGVARLLTAFYFRKHGKEENTPNPNETFEFTHKSFGEYLTARAITELVTTIHTQLDKREKTKNQRTKDGWTIEQALQEWLTRTGLAELDCDIIEFIQNEWKLQYKANPERSVAMQESLTKLLSASAAEGMPDQIIRLARPEEVRRNRNAEGNLLIALSTLASFTKNQINIQWLDSNTANIWLNRLKKGLGYPTSFIFTFLDRINFSKANLSGADLNHAYLRGVDLSESELTGVKLSDADLINANLTGAWLIKADLTNAYLIKAKLSKAELGGADLSDANLDNVDLKHANLDHAKLLNTAFHNADLRYARIRSAYLYGANLRQADLSHADFGDAKQLTVSQLNQTFSLYKTQFPYYINTEEINPDLLEPPK